MVANLEKIRKFLGNMREASLYELAFQLLTYPETRFYFLNCAEEYWKAFAFPIEEDKKGDKNRDYEYNKFIHEQGG